jgi:hypothetical protein
LIEAHAAFSQDFEVFDKHHSIRYKGEPIAIRKQLEVGYVHAQTMKGGHKTLRDGIVDC